MSERERERERERGSGKRKGKRRERKRKDTLPDRKTFRTNKLFWESVQGNSMSKKT